jgi:F-type H+-transporting ATPase subunit delta
MTHRGIARRYAGALFDVISTSGDPARARRDLDGVAAVIRGHAELERVLENPAVAPQKKGAVMAAILDHGDVVPEVRRLLLMLAERDRLLLVGDIATLFAERVMAASRILPAEVVTAAPLSEASRQKLAAALGRATGSDVTLTERVDPAIVGGVVAKVGSVVFDGSVTRQIEKMRQKLLAEA